MRTDTHNENLLEKLQESSLYQIYEKAFEEATGLTFLLQPENITEWTVAGCKGSFCQLLNAGNKTCSACIHARRCLASTSKRKIGNVSCFAGLEESAVPVRIGNTTMAYLTIGQVFHNEPEAAEIKAVADALKNQGVGKEDVDRLMVAYLDCPVVSKKKFRASMTLLAAFSAQLAALANGIMIESNQADPAVVTKAKQFIMAHLEEPMTLEMVASHVGISPFYFCKLFKRATDMTFTEYVNRRRIERAKRRLLAPNSRVTEVAYDVGYQSLSQFNRSFLKYAGESPTQYREHARAGRVAMMA
jgi:AraC-like DNA-binding protein/ligand-binding sensor protein